jgi:hypothetical protein
MNRNPLERKGAVIGSSELTGKPQFTRTGASKDLSDTSDTSGTGKLFGGSRRRRPSRKYKKSAKRVFRKKSRSTRRR